MVRSWRDRYAAVANAEERMRVSCGEDEGGENEEGMWVQDATKHVLDRARTHESSKVQVVQARG